MIAADPLISTLLLFAPGKNRWLYPRATTVLALLCSSLLISSPAEARVRLEGVDEPLKSNILAHMRLDDEPCDLQPVRLRYQFGRAPDAIRAALRPFGYYEPVIEASFEEPEEECWRAVFRIDPGEPVLVTATDIAVRGEGAELPLFQQLLDQSDISVGKRLQHDAYETLKSQLLVAAHEHGFFEAELVESAIRVDRPAHSAVIALVVETGPRYRFGELKVSDEILDDRLLHRYVDFQEGAPFEQRQLRKLHNDLVRSDYFSGVYVRAMPREADKIADVVLTLEEGRRIRYGVGAGFGTDTGPILRADMVHRRLNRSGHRLELDGEISKVRQNATADPKAAAECPDGNDKLRGIGGNSRGGSNARTAIGRGRAMAGFSTRSTMP